MSVADTLIHLYLPSQIWAIPQSSTTDPTIEIAMVNLNIFGFRTRKNSIGGLREDGCRVRKPNSSSMDELPRSRANRRRDNLTSKPAKDIQSTALGSYLKSSGASTSSRKSKDEGPAPFDGSGEEGDNGADLCIVEREPSATEGKYQSSGTDAPHGSCEGARSGGVVGDERGRKDLETDLAESRRQVEEVQKAYLALEKSYNTTEKTLRDVERRNGELERVTGRAREDMNQHKRNITELNRAYGEVQEAMRGQGQKITELTQTISLFGNRCSTTTRDDDYFEGEFSKLAGVIQQWVMRYFRGASDVKFQDLPQEVQDSLNAAIFRDGSEGEYEIKIKEIEAVVVQYLTNALFSRSSFGLPWHEPIYHSFCSVYELLQGTDIEIRKWQAQTIDMIRRDNKYEEHFNDGVHKIVNDLGNLLHIRVTRGRDVDREKGLFVIVEQAAKLSEEISRQVAPFELHRIRPGDPYNPDFMEDRSGSLLDDEGKEQHDEDRVIVHKVLFPIVLRSGFDEAGKLIEVQIVIRKGTVIVMRSGERGGSTGWLA